MSKIEKLEKLIEENKFASNAEKRRVERALKELEELKRSNADRTN